MVAIKVRQLEVPSGQCLLLRDVSWAEFEAILEDLGNHRSTRLAYDNGLLEIMAPLPEHEYFKQSISIAIEETGAAGVAESGAIMGQGKLNVVETFSECLLHLGIENRRQLEIYLKN